MKVTNSLGEIESSAATLVVEDAPSIVTQPVPGYFPVSGQVAATVQAAGAPALRYQWQRNGKDIAGQTQANLQLSAAKIADSGRYRVVVTNDVGRAISRSVALTVQEPPKITLQPLPVTIYEGETATLTVKATGTATLRYRWLHNGVEVSRNRTLVFKDARMAKAGVYWVEVSNLVGTATSNSVNLTIRTVPAPTITLLVPLELRAGQKFALKGANLQFTRTVTVGGRKVSFVKTPGNEVVGTIPTTFTSGGVVAVTSLGGTAQAASPLVVHSSAENDLFVNSSVLTGTKVKGKTSNFAYTVEPGEPFPNRAKSAWWRWVAPVTGRFDVDTLASSYDTILAVYQGDNLPTLSLLAWNDNDPVFGGNTSRLTFSAIEGVAYRFVVDATSAALVTGPTYLNIKQENSAPPDEGLLLVEEGAEAQGEPDPAADNAAAAIEATAGGTAVLLGGVAAPGQEPVVYWQPELPQALTDAGQVTLSFGMELLAAENDGAARDYFSWTLYNDREEPLLGLVANAEDGSLLAVDADGTSFELEPVLQPGAGMQVEVVLDTRTAIWSLRIDGATLLSGLPFSPAGNCQSSALLDLAIQCHRSGTTRAALWCRDLSVTALP